MTPIAELAVVGKDYGRGETLVHALRDVDLTVPAGRLVIVFGPSGAGKTTLLNLLGGLDRPTTGRVVVDGVELSSLAAEELVAFRRERVGFVFQSFGLLSVLTAAENVELPLRLQRVEPNRRDARVHELLGSVGLTARAGHRPAELSGGEQQRVAFARALANRPRLLLADEPTAQLDSDNARRALALLGELVRQHGVSAVVATHDPILLEQAEVLVELRDGRVASARSAGEFIDS